MIDPSTAFFGNAVEADMRLTQLHDYLLKLDTLIAQADSSRTEAASWEEEETAQYYAEEFPRILHKSFIIALVIFLEQELRGYCRTLKRHLSLPISMADFKGDLLERFGKYVAGYVQLKLVVGDQLWLDTGGLIEIRNLLVHSQTDLREFRGKKAIQAFSKRYRTPGIADGFVEVDRNTCLECLAVTKRFLETVYKVAMDRFPRK